MSNEMQEARIIRNSTMKQLEVVIDEAEREENTDRLLQALAREEELKNNLAAYRADINGDLKGVRKTIKDMRASLDSGKEIQAVACEEVWNFEDSDQEIEGEVDVPANSVALVRTDTWEIVGEPRAITAEERQHSLFGASRAPELPEPQSQPAEQGAQAQAAAPIDPDECRRLDLRALHCGLCEDDACLKCCRLCDQHSDTMTQDQIDGCRRELEEHEQPYTLRCTQVQAMADGCGQCEDDDCAGCCWTCTKQVMPEDEALICPEACRREVLPFAPQEAAQEPQEPAQGDEDVHDDPAEAAEPQCEPEDGEGEA